VKQIVEGASHVFKHDNNIRNLRHHPHEKNNAGVAQNALHDDLILNFLKKIISDLWIKYLFNRTRRVVKGSFMNN
jgi:hypothetical protein